MAKRKTRARVVIMGAAGRDFHNFNMCFRDDPSVEVVAFTAAQIPGIEGRDYPASLAGKLYPKGIPIRAEEELTEIIKDEDIDRVVFAYSDVTHEYVMHRASLCLSLGADFELIGPKRTMLTSAKPVIAVTAVRTGCGKSGVSRFSARVVKACGLKPVLIRHPMPYGELAKKKVERFATLSDLKKHDLTIEELEEYEPIVEAGFVVYSGVDYAEILKRAEKEADLLIWDGGNNDLSFIRPDLTLTVVDPFRPAHEFLFHPGEANLRMADFVIINKSESASSDAVALLYESVAILNPTAKIIETRSKVRASEPSMLRGKKVLVIEDGPTLTHGGMNTGAGIKAAEIYGATPVDPRPFAKGSIKRILERYSSIGDLVPAMGYTKEQIRELRALIDAVPAEAVLIATPVNLANIIDISKPVIRVSYEVEDIDNNLGEGLEKAVFDLVKAVKEDNSKSMP